MVRESGIYLVTQIMEKYPIYLPWVGSSWKILLHPIYISVIQNICLSSTEEDGSVIPLGKAKRKTAPSPANAHWCIVICIWQIIISSCKTDKSFCNLFSTSVHLFGLLPPTIVHHQHGAHNNISQFDIPSESVFPAIHPTAPATAFGTIWRKEGKINAGLHCSILHWPSFPTGVFYISDGEIIPFPKFLTKKKCRW